MITLETKSLTATCNQPYDKKILEINISNKAQKYLTYQVVQAS